MQERIARIGLAFLPEPADVHAPGQSGAGSMQQNPHVRRGNLERLTDFFRRLFFEFAEHERVGLAGREPAETAFQDPPELDPFERIERTDSGRAPLGTAVPPLVEHFVERVAPSESPRDVIRFRWQTKSITFRRMGFDRGHCLLRRAHAPSSPALLPRTDASSTGVGPGEKGARILNGAGAGTADGGAADEGDPADANPVR